jgi:hypothetical protein
MRNAKGAQNLGEAPSFARAPENRGISCFDTTSVIYGHWRDLSRGHSNVRLRTDTGPSCTDHVNCIIDHCRLSALDAADRCDLLLWRVNASMLSTAATLGSLDDLIQRGARQIIQQAIEAELATLLKQYENVKTPADKRAVARNGYLPEHEVVTTIGSQRIPGLKCCRV